MTLRLGEDADVTTPSDWKYPAGNGVWSSKASAAVTVLDGGGGGSSVFYDAFLGMYVAINRFVLDGNLYHNVSYMPPGPWSAPTPFYVDLPAYRNNPDYAALAHPEFASGSGQKE